jgi:hypothetical protein
MAESRARHFGGVSARQEWPASRHTDDNDDDLAAARKQGAHPHFTYQGGPIITSPTVYLTFWGAPWQSDPGHQQRQQHLTQFVADFLNSPYMNILSQYGVGKGAGTLGGVHGTSVVPGISGQLSDTDIHTHIQAMIDAGTVPEPSTPSNMALIIYMADPIEIRDPGLGVIMCEPSGDTAFGYHNFFHTRAGNPFYYSIIPALTDACLKESCPQDQQCSLHLALTQEQRQTQVTSHEFSEMVTDPEINAWRDGRTGAENGDICNGRSGIIIIGGNTWTVQAMYSLTDDRDSHGANMCVLGEPNPLPSLLAHA